MKVDDDLEVELLDDPSPSVPRTIELRPRRRWRELLLVVGAVAVVAGVGLIDDGGDDEVAAEPKTTTSRRPSTTIRHRSATTRHRAPAHPSATASTTRSNTTTTTWPQRTAGTGPLLPGPLTGQAVGVVAGNGTVTMVDLDTGDTCRDRPAPDGAWTTWNLPEIADRLLVQTNGQSLAIDRACGHADTLLRLEEAGPIASSAERVWVTYQGGTIVEHALPSGEQTGRTVQVPRFGFVTAAVMGDDLVVGVNGEMTLLDPSTDERRPLGPGSPLAVHGTLLAYATCPEMTCMLGLLDITSGERRTIETVAPVIWEASAFSPDGTWLRVPIAGRDEYQPGAAVIDVRTDFVRTFDDPMQSAQLTDDGRWLVALVNGSVVAYSLADGEPFVFLPELKDVGGFALL